MSTSTFYDVVILGCGPSGLAVAGGLARQLYSVLVISSGSFRNARASHMHNVLGFDHVPPPTFREKARSDILARYSTVSFLDDTTIVSAAKSEDGKGFEVADSTGQTWRARKLVIATGVTDVIPEDELPGYGACWGHGIFHCLFCDGYEERGVKSVGMLAVGDLAAVGMAEKQARMARRLAESVTMYTNGSEELKEQLEKTLAGSVRGTDRIRVDARRIERLEKVGEKSEVLVKFKDGDEVVQGFLVHKPKTVPNGPFAEQLGLQMTPAGDIKVNQPFGETSVPGVFAVGDAAIVVKIVPTATATGAAAAAGLAMQLQAE